MKFKTLQILLLLITVSAVSQEFKTPVDYLTFIGNEQVNISKSMWKYTSAVAHSKNARKIDNTRKDLIKIIQNAGKKIAGLKNGYKGDVQYRDQVVHYLNVSENNINEEYGKIIDMQEVAEQSYDFMEAYMLARDLVNKKIEEENDKATNAQNEFALKYNITITQDNGELSKKMAISDEVFKYHTAIYLIFFKANVTDLYLSKAIESKDLGAIQQNAGTLIQYADEGLEKLKAIPSYKNDDAFLISTKKSLEFYKKQAEQYVPAIVSFYMLNEKFDRARQALESKSQKDQTKEEVDNFNVMVKQINKEVENYNKLANANNQEKNAILNNWNMAGDNFISKHIPQG